MNQPTADGSTIDQFLDAGHPDLKLVKELMVSAMNQGFKFRMDEVPEVNDMDKLEPVLIGVRETASWVDRLMIFSLDLAAASRRFKQYKKEGIVLRNIEKGTAFQIITHVLEWPTLPLRRSIKGQQN